MDQQVAIALGGREFTATRARLGLYLRLEIIRSRLLKETKAKGGGEIADALFDYISLCVPELTREEFDASPWFEAINAFLTLATMNMIQDDFAILRHHRPSGPSAPWDYPERLRVSWIHLIADAYKWRLEEIENLFLEDAVAFAQEIEVSEQMRNEFLHSLSEVAYPYNEGTKKHHYKPLTRPLWMVMRDEESVKTMIPKWALPAGKIVTLEEQSND